MYVLQIHSILATPRLLVSLEGCGKNHRRGNKSLICSSTIYTFKSFSFINLQNIINFHFLYISFCFHFFFLDLGLWWVNNERDVDPDSIYVTLPILIFAEKMYIRIYLYPWYIISLNEMIVYHNFTIGFWWGSTPSWSLYWGWEERGGRWIERRGATVSTVARRILDFKDKWYNGEWYLYDNKISTLLS